MASILKKDLLRRKGTAKKSVAPLPGTVKVMWLLSIQVCSFLRKLHHTLMSCLEKVCRHYWNRESIYAKTIPVRFHFHGVLGFALF